jgi:hypothetical protein
MFEQFMKSNNDEAKKEERMLQKQIEGQNNATVLGNATDANSDMTYLEQQKQREDLVMWQQNLEPELELMIHDLRNEFYDYNSETWVQKTDINGEKLKPLCNEQCIQTLVPAVRPLVSKNMIMGNFSEERVLQILKRTMGEIVININMNYDSYGIDWHQISRTLSIIKNTIQPAPFRALNNGERKYLSTINRRVENYSSNPVTEPKKKFLGIFG